MKKIALLIAVIAITFTSCDETKKVIDVAGSVQLSGSYVVNTIADYTGSNSKSGDALTLNFAALDRSIRGNAGCNTFFGNYTLDLYAINIGTLAVTEKLCNDNAVMERERAYLNALNTTGSYSLENNILTLYSKNDRSVLLTATKDTEN